MSADTGTNGLLIQLCCWHRSHQSCRAGANARWISMDAATRAPEVDVLGLLPRGHLRMHATRIRVNCAICPDKYVYLASVSFPRENVTKRKDPKRSDCTRLEDRSLLVSAYYISTGHCSEQINFPECLVLDRYLTILECFVCLWEIG